MSNFTRIDLQKRSPLELGVLHDMFNKQLAAQKPFTASWLHLVHVIDAVQTERRGRLERPWRASQ